MNYMNRLIIASFVILSFTTVSCNNDDDPEIPTNAITLNMTAGDSETTIGGSDVYINLSNNFTSSYCGIANIGQNGGFNKNPDLSQIAQNVAVTPGNYYQIIHSDDVRTIAGARAVPVNTNYYNVHVDSWIYDKDNDIAGARISYAECYPKTDVLPGWNSSIDLTLQQRKYAETAKYTFPNGCEIDDNIEVYDSEGSDMKRNLDIELNGNQISFSNSSWTPGGEVQVIIRVRYGSIYTRIFLNVKSSM